MPGKTTLNGTTVFDGPDPRKRNTEYNVDGTIKYIGWAPPQALTSDDTWTIYSFTYDGSSREITKTTAFNVSWDNRATVSYA